MTPVNHTNYTSLFLKNAQDESEEECFDEQGMKKDNKMPFLVENYPSDIKITQYIKSPSIKQCQGIINNVKNSFKRGISFIFSYPKDPYLSSRRKSKRFKICVEKVNQMAIEELNMPFFSLKTNKCIKDSIPESEFEIRPNDVIALHLHSEILPQGCEYNIKIVEAGKIPILNANIVAVDRTWAYKTFAHKMPIIDGLYNPYCLENYIRTATNRREDITHLLFFEKNCSSKLPISNFCDIMKDVYNQTDHKTEKNSFFRKKSKSIKKTVTKKDVNQVLPPISAILNDHSSSAHNVTNLTSRSPELFKDGYYSTRHHPYAIQKRASSFRMIPALRGVSETAATTDTAPILPPISTIFSGNF